MFRDGIRPAWEDNKNEGMFTCSLMNVPGDKFNELW